MEVPAVRSNSPSLLASNRSLSRQLTSYFIFRFASTDFEAILDGLHLLLRYDRRYHHHVDVAHPIRIPNHSDDSYSSYCRPSGMSRSLYVSSKAPCCHDVTEPITNVRSSRTLIVAFSLFSIAFCD